MEIDDFSKIYIQTEKIWDKGGQCKFGYTGHKKRSLLKRLNDSHEQHSYRKKLKAAFKVRETGNYNFDFKEHDEIIKIFLYEPEIIQGLEKHLDCQFEYCSK